MVLKVQLDLLPACPGVSVQAAAAARQLADPPAQARGQPAHVQVRRGLRVRAVAHGHAADVPQRLAHTARVERGRHALAPRGRAQPGQVDDVGLLEELLRPGGAPPRGRGPRPSRRGSRRRCGAAGRRPLLCPCGDHSTVSSSGTTTGSTTVSSMGRCCGPTSISIWLAHRRDLPRRRPGVGRGHPGPRRDVVAALLDHAHDRARRAVAADLLEPVGDLAAPLAVDDDDEVEHARGRVHAAALGRTLAEEPPAAPPRCRSACSSPGSRCRRSAAASSGARARAAQRASSGPSVPAGYCGSGIRPRCARPRGPGRRSAR